MINLVLIYYNASMQSCQLIPLIVQLCPHCSGFNTLCLLPPTILAVFATFFFTEVSVLTQYLCNATPC